MDFLKICLTVHSSGLYIHKRSVHENRLFKCPYEGCDHPGYKSNRSLIEHIQSMHTRDRPYECGTCGKTFITLKKLKDHSTTHNSESRFQCNCGAKFRHQSSLCKT
ncbi:hypothetical protein KIN20_013947 [Parelaphostrongylus tenuis]|uniref:C2H2-type domain-containing protein n=1 Tax=Parelaphostrongylus tenuis TaxID=148309 RepID=A0AAD5MCV9_PARTN|nr:hypothetical protein KIN20_013947 [Parelaphostrongylus tenuis]